MCKAKVLIIEDEPEVLEVMVIALRHAGCEVEAVADGEEGLEQAETGRFDLISTDVDLPGMSGFEICSRLKENPQLRSTPVVFVSGRGEEADLNRGRELGAVDYITKPFDLMNFVSRLISHVKFTSTGQRRLPND